VRVKDQYQFVYPNGSPYRELRTTCYTWTSQPAALEEETLKTLADAPFNKMRMCVFPKWYHYNQVEPAAISVCRTGADAAPSTATVLAERNTWGVQGEYYLTYLWDRQHATQSYSLPEDAQFRAEIIDTIAMTITPIEKPLTGHAEIALPIKPYLAIRVVRI